MAKKNQIRAFTIIEILVVVSIIALLASFLMVALSGSQEAAKTAKVNVKLKDIGQWMQLWSGENQNRVLPSQFDFTDEAASGSVVTARRDVNAPDDNLDDALVRGQYQGTWTDILWTENNMHQIFGLADRQELEPGKLRWESDSPDNNIFEIKDTFNHPFRSTFANTRGLDKGLPGYFAANDFFDARSEVDTGIDRNGDGTLSSSDWYYTYAMMHAPARSVYLVDSVASETIGDDEDSWDVSITIDGGPVTQTDVEDSGVIDFRYGDDCLMLMLDGSIARIPRWSERGPQDPPPAGTDLSLYGLGYRAHQLTRRVPR